MGILNWLFEPKSRPADPLWRTHKRGYDATKASRHLDNHFLDATGSDADTLISDSLETARNRCRYEVRNNTYAEGIVETLANDIVGSGPQLQLKTSSNEFNRAVESRWLEFCQACDMAGRLEMCDFLRLDMRQLCESGESFTTFGLDPAADGPAFRLLSIEADRINSPMGLIYSDEVRQGIQVDKYGKPLLYYVQKTHPGSMKASFGSGLNEYDQIAAELMIHLARISRPGQTRSMPWLQPALPLFAQLRRYTLAVLTAAEHAADFSGVMKSDGTLGTTDDIESLETIDIERGSMLTLPKGWEMQQFKAEQPTASYESFKHEILNEIARCLNMPYNVAAANSSSYNYASGRLDWQVYYRFISTIQNWIGRIKLNRILKAWLDEAVLLRGYLPTPPDDFIISANTVAWYWPGTEHVDPVKEAQAEQIRMQTGTLTLAAAYAKQGKDWELELEQKAREQAKITELGLSIGTPQNAQQTNEKEDGKDPEDEKDDADRKPIRAVG